MARSIIIPRIIRGDLFYECAGILFASRCAAMCAATLVLEQQLAGAMAAQGGGQ